MIPCWDCAILVRNCGVGQTAVGLVKEALVVAIWAITRWHVAALWQHHAEDSST